jgi:hypothetical protein
MTTPAPATAGPLTPKRVEIRVPESMHAEIAAYAAKSGVSWNKAANWLLRDGLDHEYKVTNCDPRGNAK